MSSIAELIELLPRPPRKPLKVCDGCGTSNEDRVNCIGCGVRL